MWLTLLKSLLEALAQYFKWKAIETEIHLKAIVLESKEQTEDEMDQIRDQIEKLRAEHVSDSDAAATRLRRKLAQRAIFSTDISAYLSLFKKGEGDPD